MCVKFDGDWRTARHELIAYKVVRVKARQHPRTYTDLPHPTSVFRPGQRFMPYWWVDLFGPLRGDLREYTPGRHSCDKPGFFMVLTHEAAAHMLDTFCMNTYGQLSVIQVTIPKSTRYITGEATSMSSGTPCVNALTIEVSK